MKKLLGYAGHAMGSLSLYTFFDFCARLWCDTVNYPQFIPKVIQKQDIVLPPRGLVIHYDRFAAKVVTDSVQVLSGFDISKIFYDKIYEGTIASNNSVIKIAAEYSSKATGLPVEWAGGIAAVFLILGPIFYLCLAYHYKHRAEPEVSTEQKIPKV